MSKFAKDIKTNDIIWAIQSGPKPQILPLIVININIRELLFTGYYDLTLRLPDGTDKYISLFDTGYRRDYNNPFFTDLIDDLKDLSYDNGRKTIIASFDKESLLNDYIEGLEKQIKNVEEIIENGKKNLIELNEKLNYIKKQNDNIQEGQFI